jgi:hypothetical protein
VARDEIFKRFVNQLAACPVPKTILVHIDGNVHAINLNNDWTRFPFEMREPNARAAEYLYSPARLPVMPNGTLNSCSAHGFKLTMLAPERAQIIATFSGPSQDTRAAEVCLNLQLRVICLLYWTVF